MRGAGRIACSAGRRSPGYKCAKHRASRAGGWHLRTNVWRRITSPAGGPWRLMAHDGSSHMLDLRLGIRRQRQRREANQRWPVLRPVPHEARHSRTGATDARERHQAGRQRRSVGGMTGIESPGRVLGLPCGSPIARVPLPISCDALPAREGSDAFPSTETS